MSLGVSLAGMGLVTSVGQGVAQACAAIRANISRPAPIWPPVSAFDDTNNEAAPVVGHPVRGLTEGFQGVGRLKQLALAAVSDLQRQIAANHLPSFSSEGRVYLCLARDLESRMHLRASDLTILGQALQETVRSSPPTIITSGPASVFEAIRLASEDFQRWRLPRALIVAVDSLLDEDSIEMLIEQGRLKTLENPVGLSPGEAAGCLLIAPQGVDQSLPLVDVARSTGVELVDASPAQVSREMSQHLSEVLVRSSGRLPGDVIVNLSGEERGATIWGSFLSRVKKDAASWEPRVTAPVTQIGDIGAAFAAVGIALAAHSITRRHASNDDLLVTAISNDCSGQFCRVTRPSPSGA